MTLSTIVVDNVYFTNSMIGTEQRVQEIWSKNLLYFKFQLFFHCKVTIMQVYDL